MPSIKRPISWLSEVDISSLNRFLIVAQTPAEPIGVLNYSGLASAQYRAIQYQHYAKTDDVFKLGAVFAEALVQNHPFYNANKRTAAAAVMVFLLINGRQLRAPWEQVVEIFEGLAKHNFDVEEFEFWLVHWSVKFDVSELESSANKAYNSNETIRKYFF